MAFKWTWTDAKFDIAVEMANEGASSAMIATRLGCTRSAVCGKFHRAGITRLGENKKRGAPRKRRRTRTKNTRSGQHIKAFERPPQKIRDDDERRELAQKIVGRKTILDIEADECRFPSAAQDASGQWLFCAAQRMPGSVYCRSCHDLAYDGINPVRRNRKSTTTSPSSTADARGRAGKLLEGAS